MKIIKSLFAFTSVFTMKQCNTQSIINSWPEIEPFNDLMISSYKSAKKGNFVPIKNQAETLNENAKKLGVENMPQKYRLPKNIENLVQLKRESQSIKDLVEKNATNEQIFECLKSIHHTFKKMTDSYNHKN
jgi:hypothetical protein